MSQHKRRLVMLGGLAVALTAAVTIARENAQDVAPTRRPARQAARTAPPVLMPVTDLRLSLLRDAPTPLGNVDRNLFRFGSRPAAALAPRDGPATPPVASPEPATPSQPTVPPIPLRYIGLLEAPGRVGRVAILSDGQGHILYGTEGDTIDGRYLVGQVGPLAMELSYLDGRGRQTIRLSGQ